MTTPQLIAIRDVQSGSLVEQLQLKDGRSASRPLFDGLLYDNPWTAQPDDDSDEYDEEDERLRQRSFMSFLCSRAFGCKDDRVPEPEVLDAELPVLEARFNNDPRSVGQPLELTWIGHATSVLRIDGLSLITDPIFSQYCAPVGFGGVRRVRKVPCEIKHLPDDLRLVVISHNHYDHLDFKSIRSIHKRYRNNVTFCVPEGLAEWFRSNLSGLRPDGVIELSWWQSVNFQLGSDGPKFKVISVPAQHWSMRKPGNRNHSLWCGWVIIGPSGRKFYFAGDTGYCPGFKQIGAELGPIDLATIPCGAYKPRVYLRHSHINPSEAVKVHLDVQAKKSVGVHWGTFKLGGEKTLATKTDLPVALAKKNVSADDFLLLQHGETHIFK